MNGHEPVFGHIWVAQGAERKGTVIIPPQTWGGDSLESVVIPLLHSGINAISFVPIGMWDRTQRTYTMFDAVDDVHALIDWVRSNDYDPNSPIGQFRRRLDPNRIALFGLSGGGGNVSLAACAESDHVHHVVAVRPQNMAHNLTVEATRASYEMVGRPWFADAGIAKLPDVAERLFVNNIADRLAPNHILIVSAQYEVEEHHRPLVGWLRAAGAEHLDEVVWDTGSGFITKRYALARLLIEWLREHAAF
ncbi:alpha/beta hydrolase family protein [Microbacterium trichothecenolyticum]|nr:hypothetical protein [Microbacterium trichothecenolyticum]